jgi:uncharacterized membrane protein YbhN (UPF0104 family)
MSAQAHVRVAARGLPALRWVVSLAAVVLLVWWASRQHLVLPTGGDARLRLAGALAVLALAMALRCERWHRLLTVWGGRWGRADAYGTTLVGYMGNNVLPARAGDILKTGLAAARARIPLSQAITATLAERALDVVALLTLFAATGAVAVRHAPAAVRPALYVLAGVAVVGAAALAFASRSPRMEGVRRALRPARALAGPPGLVLLAFSLVIWVLESTVYLLVAHAVGITLGLPGAAYVVGLTNLVTVIPAGPGYLGTFDAGVLIGLTAVGASARVAYVLVLRVVLFVPVTVVGAVLLVTRYGGMQALRPAPSRS